MVRKAAAVKTVEVLETEKITEEENIPKRYYIQFWKSTQPADTRFDTLAGTVYWSDVEQDIIIETLDNKYASEVENLLTGDFALPNGVFVSRKSGLKMLLRQFSETEFTPKHLWR